MKKVIGKYFVIAPGILDECGMTEEELIEFWKQGGVELKMGTFGTSRIKVIERIKERRARKAIKYINSIGAEITEYDNDTGLTRLDYNEPIPIKYFKKLHDINNVHFIYEDQQKNTVPSFSRLDADS